MPDKRKQETSYYMVSINDVETSRQLIPAEKVLEVLAKAGVWQISEYAHGRTSMSPGDRLVFYMAGKDRRYLAGTATVASKPVPIPEGQNMPFMRLSFSITDIDIWDEPTPIRPLLPKLSFVEERLIRYWGLYFRQATRRLSKEDFQILTRRRRKRKTASEE